MIKVKQLFCCKKILIMVDKNSWKLPESVRKLLTKKEIESVTIFLKSKQTDSLYGLAIHHVSLTISREKTPGTIHIDREIILKK